MSDMIEVYTHFKRPKVEKEINSGQQITETAGYIPADVQIQDMIAAGMRLGEYRREMYDFDADDEVPENYFDPTRVPGVDVVDVERAGIAVNAKIAEAQELLKKAEEEKAALDAEKKVE
nr:MAG: hypothetical protein [Microvirus sp.]